MLARRLTTRARPLLLVALVVGCGDDASGTGATDGATASTATSLIMTASTSVGTASGTSTSVSTGTATAGESTSAGTTDGTTTAASGPIFDVGSRADFGEDTTGGELPLTCANISQENATSVGCEFWGIDAPMLQSNELAYGISVGNPTEEIATVTLEDMRGQGDTLRMITQVVLQPKQSQLILVNGSGGILPGDHKIGLNGLTARGAFRVTSDVPITAMQVNPVGGGPSHVSEASLLLPTQALGESYFALSYPTGLGFNGWVIVVAVEDGTMITTKDGDYALDAFDAWTFPFGGDLDPTGYFVGSDKPVAVFSGAECVLIPGQPWYACDHLEEQVVPAAAWGTRYVGARHPQRVPGINPTPEEVRWRLLAGVDNTTITLTPPQPSVGGQVKIAGAGQWVEFASADSFLADGDQPFMLTQYMSGCYNVIKSTGDPMNCNQGPTGDPYMIQMPPVDQWLTQTPFLTDTSYPRDFVVIMREAGTTVTLDCLGEVPPDHFTAIPGTQYEIGHVDLDQSGGGGEGTCVDGEQFIAADQPIGIYVGGLDWATSYGYPGGLNFKALWVPPKDPPG